MNKEEILREYATKLDKYEQELKAWKNITIDYSADSVYNMINGASLTEENDGQYLTVSFIYLEKYFSVGWLYLTPFSDDYRGMIDKKIKELKERIDITKKHIDFIQDVYDNFDTMMKNVSETIDKFELPKSNLKNFVDDYLETEIDRM